MFKEMTTRALASRATISKLSRPQKLIRGTPTQISQVRSLVGRAQLSRSQRELNTVSHCLRRLHNTTMTQQQKDITKWASDDGSFKRQTSAFRDAITKPSEGGKFPAEKGRYYLYVSYACPWAHRTLIVRALKGLQDYIRQWPRLLIALRHIDELTWVTAVVPVHVSPFS